MTRAGYTHIEIPYSSLALFNQLKAEEAGRQDKPGMKSEDFFKYLLLQYMRVREDTGVRIHVIEKMRKQDALAEVNTI